MIHTVYCDLDGTLVDSAPGILSSFEQVLCEAGVPLIAELDNSVIGPPLALTMRRLTGVEDPARAAELVRDFKRVYDTRGVLGAEVYAGAQEAILEVTAAGRRIFVVTNKRLGPAVAILERIGIRPLFAGVYSLDAFDPPLLSKAEVVARLLDQHQAIPREVALVGDSRDDAEAARLNHVPLVAATYGYGSLVNAELPVPAVCIASIAELPAAIRQLD